MDVYPEWWMVKVTDGTSTLFNEWMNVGWRMPCHTAERPLVFCRNAKLPSIYSCWHTCSRGKADNPGAACGQCRIMIRALAVIIHYVSLAEIEKTLNPSWQLAWFSLHMPNHSNTRYEMMGNLIDVRRQGGGECRDDNAPGFFLI